MARRRSVVAAALMLAGCGQPSKQAENGIVAVNAIDAPVSSRGEGMPQTTAPPGPPPDDPMIVSARDAAIDGRKLLGTMNIVEQACGTLPATVPLDPVEDAHRNFRARKTRLFAVTDMGAGTVVWGYNSGLNPRLAPQVEKRIAKYGAMYFRIADTCPSLDTFYAVILPAYNRAIMDSIDRAEGTGIYANAGAATVTDGNSIR